MSLGSLDRQGRTALVLAALLLLLALVAAGCDGDDEATTTEVTGGAETTAGTATTEGPDTTDLQSEAEVLYADNCASCHGPEGEGGVGPAFQGNTELTTERAEQMIRNGGNGMPPFEGQLSDDQIQALASHVVEELAAE